VRCAAIADRIIATDNALVPAVLRHLRVPEERVAVVPNAVDLEAIDRNTEPAAATRLRTRIGAGTSDRLLLSVGRLEANKGFDVLLRALAAVRTAVSSD
jgi:glycosyltransferase involved in cell wall biosynthesis